MEFDIFEAWGTPVDRVRAQMNVHFTKDGHYRMNEPDPDDAFHVFALEWDEGRAVVCTGRVRGLVFGAGELMRLNLSEPVPGLYRNRSAHGAVRSWVD